MKVIFYQNGNTAVVDAGAQVGELQEPWFLLFVKFLESHGVRPEDCDYQLPGGRARIFKTDVGYNWEMLGC